MNFVSIKLPILALLAILLLTPGQSSYAEERIASHGEISFDGDKVVLPLVARSMHPIVGIDLGDGEQQRFIVDTGASVNVIDSAIAKSQGYEVVGETEIGAPGGPQIPAAIVKVPVIHVGEVTIQDAEFVTMDLEKFTRGTTQGVLGLPLFRDHLLTFDIGGGQLVVSHDSLNASEPGVVAYVSPDEHIQIDVDVAGTTITTHIDTGSMAEFTLPGDMADSLPVSVLKDSGMKARLVGGERDIQFGQLDGTLGFAGLAYENPKVSFITPSFGHGNIGSGVMRDLVVSVDQRKNLIAFQTPTRNSAARANNKPRRIGVQFHGMSGGSQLTVAGVMPETLAAKAGLLAGDVLVALNGKPTENYDMSDLRALFGGTEPLRFELEREGESKTIEIQ